MTKEPENKERIISLPDFIANQIAAGEVVQRPESVVKELIENAFDAEASAVTIVVKDAGKKLIHIIDNGKGIHKEDLPLAIKRHATSKIRKQQDLEAISSYGFRGEALASIAAVASIEIRTIRKGDEHGWKLIAEPGQAPKIEPALLDVGSQIFVKNLFYNVPARKKFLKSNLTELRHISDTIMRFALIMPEKRIVFYDDDNLIFDLKPQGWKDRAAGLMGADIFNKLIDIEYETDFLKVEGFIGSPEVSRQTKSMQFLYLNKRPIQSKSLSHAIYAVYENLLAKSSHPVYLLNLTIDFDKVDVNVHPQKHEVKFEDERGVYNVLRDAVYKTLNKTYMIPDFGELSASNPFQKAGSDIAIVNRVTGEVFDDFSAVPFSAGGRFSGRNFEREPQLPQSAYDIIFSEEKEPEDAFIPALKLEPRNSAKLRLKDFLIINKDFGIRIIYIQRAYGEIIFETLLNQYNKGASESQALLFPHNIRLSGSEMILLNEIRKELETGGWLFEIRDEMVTILSIPAILDDNPGALKEILDNLSNDEFRQASDKAERIIFNTAMRAAWGKTSKISQIELDNLEENLLRCKSSKHNFAGLKIFEDVTEDRLKKLF